MAWLAGFNTTEFAAHPGYQVSLDGAFLVAALSMGPAALVLAAGAAGYVTARLGQARAVSAVALAAVAVFACGNALHPLGHPYPGPWHQIWTEVARTDVPWENVMIVMPPANGRDDVRGFYERRLNREMGSVDIGTVARRAASPGFHGVLVARSGDIPRLRSALQAMSPGVVLNPLARTRDLQAWELSRR